MVFWSSKAQLSSTCGFQVLHGKVHEYKVKILSSTTKVGTRSQCLHTVFVSCTSGSINSFDLPAKLKFQKWHLVGRNGTTVYTVTGTINRDPSAVWKIPKIQDM